MELGVAGGLAVKQITGEDVEKKVNDWLKDNPDLEVIEMKFATSATAEDWSTDVLIIYRKEY